MLGLALVVSIAGACWVAAEHQCIKDIPLEIWFVPAVLGGVLVGILIPFSIPLGAILGVAILATSAHAAGVCTTHNNPLVWWGVGASLGGVVLGLFVPSPGRQDP